MKKNGWKYNTGSLYGNIGTTPKFKVNKDGTKDFSREGNTIRNLSMALLGKTNITEDALKEMKSIG